jgi:hypothetical protein
MIHHPARAVSGESVEMNFYAVTKSLLKQTDPNAIYRVSAKRIRRMIHHPARASL